MLYQLSYPAAEIFRVKDFLKNNNRFSEPYNIVEVNEIEAIDIDNYSQLDLARKLALFY